VELRLTLKAAGKARPTGCKISQGGQGEPWVAGRAGARTGEVRVPAYRLCGAPLAHGGTEAEQLQDVVERILLEQVPLFEIGAEGRPPYERLCRAPRRRARTVGLWQLIVHQLIRLAERARRCAQLNQRNTVSREDGGKLRADSEFTARSGGELRDGSVVYGQILVAVQPGRVPLDAKQNPSGSGKRSRKI
jgi:hypothetical protein